MHKFERETNLCDYISIGRAVTMIVGLMFTLIPYGTDKDNIIKQFQLGRRVL